MSYIQKELFERYRVTHLDATNLQALINIMPEESPHDFDRVLQEAQRRGFFYFRKKIIPIDHEVYAGDRGSIRVANIFTPPEDYVRTNTFPNWDEIHEALSFKLDTSTFLTFEEMINRQLQSKATKQDLNTKLNISDFEVFQTGNLEALRAKMDVSTFDQFKGTLHRVAFTGAYEDLTGEPSFPVLARVAETGQYGDLLGTPNLATVATTGSYGDLLNKPNFAGVAFTGAYSDLIGTPTPLELAAVATTGSYNDLLDRPSFATVAISGKYSDLIGTPEVPTLPPLARVAETGQYGDLLGTPNLATVATTGSYGDLLNKPNFAGVAFTGAYSDLIGTPTPLELAAVATTGSYNDLLDRPSFATVAISGKYSDLIGTPEVPTLPPLARVAETGQYGDLLGTPNLATVATTGSYNDLLNKPTAPDLSGYLKTSGGTLTGPLRGTTINAIGQIYQNDGKRVLDESDIGGGNATSGTYGKLVKIGGDGVMEVGQYLDFHNSGTNVNYTTRLTTDGNNQLQISGNGRILTTGNRPIKYQHNVTVTNSTGEILMFSFINWSDTKYTSMSLIASALYGTDHVNKENALTATGVIVRSGANRFISGVFAPNGSRLDYVYAESTGAISVSNTAGWKSAVINDYVQSI